MVAHVLEEYGTKKNKLVSVANITGIRKIIYTIHIVRLVVLIFTAIFKRIWPLNASALKWYQL